MNKLFRGLFLAGAMAGLMTFGASYTAAQAKKAADEKVGTLEISKDKAGQFRFKAVGTDGKAIMQGSKGYATKDDALKAIDAIKAILAKGKVEDKE